MNGGSDAVILKKKTIYNVAVVGLRGTGKSTLCAYLATNNV